MKKYEELDRREKLLADLRALADGPGHTATIISAAADEIEIETKRADDNGKSCSEFCAALQAIANATKDKTSKETAEIAIRMPWAFESR